MSTNNANNADNAKTTKNKGPANKISSHFMPITEQIQLIKIAGSCFIELMKLARDGTAIQNPTDSEKSKVMELQKKVQKVSKDIVGITNKRTSDEVKQIYFDIADFNSQLDAFEKLVNFKKA